MYCSPTVQLGHPAFTPQLYHTNRDVSKKVEVVRNCPKVSLGKVVNDRTIDLKLEQEPSRNDKSQAYLIEVVKSYKSLNQESCNKKLHFCQTLPLEIVF